MEPTAPPVAAAPDLSLPQRIWGALVSPRAVFESLRARPRLLGAILVLVVLMVAAGFLLADLTLEQQLAGLDNRPDMTEEGRVQAERMMTLTITKVGPFLGAAIGVIVVFVIAAVLLFVGNVLLGGDAKYKQYAAGTAHASMVVIPAMLVRVPLALATGDLQATTSLAALLSPESRGTMLHTALSRLDVFDLWQVALTVIMVAVMARVDTKKAAIAVVGAWVVWTAISVPLQSFFAGLGGG